VSGRYRSRSLRERVDSDYLFTERNRLHTVKELEEVESFPVGGAKPRRASAAEPPIVGLKKSGSSYTMENVGAGNLSMPESKRCTPHASG